MYKKIYVSSAYHIDQVKTMTVKVAVIGNDKPIPEGIYIVAELPYIDVLHLAEIEDGVVWFADEGEAI